MISKLDERFTKLAYELALTSEHEITRVGAVLVANKTIISVGVNSATKSHPLQKMYNEFRHFQVEIRHLIHAEMECIIKYKKMDEEISDLKMYIARIRKNGTLVPGYPCAACQQALKEYGISSVIYSSFNDFKVGVI
jgi:deoxycytidylate deaminase